MLKKTNDEIETQYKEKIYNQANEIININEIINNKDIEINE
jgi:hypothetical protein